MTRKALVGFGIWIVLAAMAATAAEWHPAPIYGGDGRSLAVVPDDPDVLLAGTSAGQVYLSRNGGRSWTDAGAPLPFPGWVVSKLLFDPNVSRPPRLWVALWGVWGSGQVAYSDDLGKSWSARSAGLPDEPVYTLALVPGKEGRLYVLNRGNLGTASKTANDVVSEDFVLTPAPECVLQTGDAESNMHGAPVYWKSDSGAANLYLMGEGDFVHKVEIDPKLGKITERARSKERAACGMPGGFLSVSSNGDNPHTAILWANVPAGDALAAIVPATFYAYNAETLETLYRDDSRSLPRSADQFAKFVAPTIANGRVYQAAFAAAAVASGSLNADYAGSVVVYGLKSKLAYK